MARIRTIKPDFFRHEGLFELERETGLPVRLAFAGLWTAADREGRFKWSPRALKLDCLPFDDVDFSRVLDALSTRGFIVKYAVDDAQFGFIPSWHQHQAINNKERPSDIPEPNENNALTREPRVSHASVTPLCNSRGEGKGKEGKEIGADAPSSTREILPTEGPPGDAKPYAFEQGVIRLKPKDLDRWKAAFKNLDVEAELISLAEWAGRDHPTNWFHAVSGALAKRNRQSKERLEAVARGAPAKADPWSAIL